MIPAEKHFVFSPLKNQTARAVGKPVPFGMFRKSDDPLYLINL